MTDKPAFTKGPWTWRRVLGSPYCLYSLDDCVVDIGNDELLVSDADAALIAAAPDMYEALRLGLDLFDSGTPTVRARYDWCEAARAALRKAEGKE